MARTGLARWRGAMLVLLAAAQPCVAIDPVHSMMEPPPPKLQRPRVSRPVVGGLQRAGILASLSSPSLLLLPAALMGLAVAFPEPMARLALHVLQPAQNADSNSGRQGLGLASASPAQWRVGGPPHLRWSHSCSACSQRLDCSRKAQSRPRLPCVFQCRGPPPLQVLCFLGSLLEPFDTVLPAKHPLRFLVDQVQHARRAFEVKHGLEGLRTPMSFFDEADDDEGGDGEDDGDDGDAVDAAEAAEAGEEAQGEATAESADQESSEE